MSTKTTKPKTSLNGTAHRRGNGSNGDAAAPIKPEKSMYQKWIERYGVSESEADKKMVQLARKLYESNNSQRS